MEKQSMVQPRVTLFTPTYHVDLPQFMLLRESLERCGVDLPHVAVVNHEDLPEFRDLPHQNNLTLLSTREVLSREMEARRTARPHRPRHPMYWLGRKPLHGWMIQQMIKLAAPAVIETDAYVCLDSDTLALRRVVAEDFYDADGRLHLYESIDDGDAEMFGWTYEAMRFLRVPVQGRVLRRYTHAPVPMRTDLVKALQRHITQARGMDWMRAMDRWHVTEYAAYGAYARYAAGLKGLCPTAPPISLYYWWAAEFEELEHSFTGRAADPRLKFVTLQSKRADRVTALHEAVRAFWGRAERAEAVGASA